MTRTALLSGLVILGLGTMGLAQTPGAPPDLPEAELQELLDRQAEMSEAEMAAVDAAEMTLELEHFNASATSAYAAD